MHVGKKEILQRVQRYFHEHPEKKKFIAHICLTNSEPKSRTRSDNLLGPNIISLVTEGSDSLRKRSFNLDHQNFTLPNSRTEIDKRSQKIPEKILIQEDNPLWQYLKEMAHIANLGYCSINNNVGIQVPGIKSNVYHDRSQQKIIAYFTGFERKLDDWYNRRSLSPKVFSFGHIFGAEREAFVDATWLSHVDDMFPRLRTEIPKLLSADLQTVVFTGHGAAYAILAALEFKVYISDPKNSRKFSSLNIKIEVVTFGQPRVGSVSFAQAVNDVDIEIYRVTHKNDYVSRLQLPRSGVISFRHHPTEYWLTDTSCDCPDEAVSAQLYMCSGLEERQDCNAGQTGDNESSFSNHKGLYFDVEFGKCNNK
ncbi:hypothetical protein G9A89_003823 [Geosiphon pyriformis]|nr:hypothetical protein G9A89_003823 [Geosiphon pyriformis]